MNMSKFRHDPRDRGSRPSDHALVVGGGLIGVATLYELASRGVTATLLEAREELGLETSFANGGMLTPSMPDPWNSPGVGGHLFASLFDPASAMKLRWRAVPGLAFWGLEFLRNSLPARHVRSTLANYALAAFSTECTDVIRKTLRLEYDDCDAGTMKVFESKEAMASSVRLARHLEPLGLEFTVLDRAGAIDKEPRLAESANRLAGALYFPNDRLGDARKFVLGLARKAIDSGGKVRTGATVARLVRKGEAVIGVELSTGERLEGDVILAAGVSAPMLARQVNIRLPIKPAKGYSLTIDAAELGPDLPKLAVIDDAMHAAVVPLGSRLRLVGTAEFAGVDAVVRTDRIENLFAMFGRLYPSLAAQADRSTEMAWAGLRPMSADGRPFIGPSPLKGLWLNCGHGHLGWTKAIGSARLLADQMLAVQPPIDPAPFSFERR